MKRTATALLIAGLSAAGSAHAAVILEYQTAPSTPAPQTLPASNVDPAVTADDFAAGSGLIASSGGTYNFNDWAEDGTPDEPDTSFADAVGDDDVFTFGFDVNAGQIVDLTTLDIRLDRSGTGPNMVEMQASVNGAPGISLFTFDWGDGAGGEDFVGVDLSAIPTLNAGDSIVFTVAAWGADSGGASNFGTFDLETVDFNGQDPRSVRIEGTITPEPTSLALLGLGGLLIARRRR